MIRFLIPLWLIWGYNWVVMKVANTYFPPSEFVAWRFGFGAIVLLAYILIRRIPAPERKYIPWIALSGFIGIGINSLMVQTSMQYINAGLAAVINYSVPVWILIPAYFVLKEQITVRKCISIFMALMGLVLIMNIDTGSSEFFGILLAWGSALCWTASNIIIKLKLGNCPAVQLTCVQMLSAAIFLGLYNVVNPAGPINWCTESVLCLLYNGVLASAMCFFLFTYVLQHMEAAAASTAVMGVPATGVVAGIICLGETFTISTAVGMIILTAGVIMAINSKS